MKRLFDILASSVLLIALLPLMILIAAGVKLTSRGPIFFRQVRIGWYTEPFQIWKFRTLYTGNHVGQVTRNDPQVTWFGRFLRKTSLDELPQLWNILIGDMSLVGPRPLTPNFYYEYNIPIERSIVRPGLTGLAQILGHRGICDMATRVKLDLEYKPSVSGDLKIIIQTIPVVFTGY
ncbi:MAG: sugar transferase [Candidatus Omnitrophota bacterium]|jgi:putative colanic acid biosynthesis UDP-glucose lipid carrier transferase